MKKFYLFFAVLVISFFGAMLVPSRSSAFSANNLMDDAIFENSSTMSSAAIDSWLNATFPSSCISSNANGNGNAGFRTPDPLGWSDAQNKYLYGANTTAGKAIADAAILYHINPQVILATLQKEQSVVSGNAGCHYNSPDPATATNSPCGSAKTPCTVACVYSGGCMNIAMSYGCPNYCAAKDEGFAPQLTLGTWLLRFSQQRAYGRLTGYAGYESGDEGFTYAGPMTAGFRQRVSGGPSIYYDGTYTTQDGTSVSIANGATASLYTYTPFISGNQSFSNTFTNWFGNTVGPGYQFSSATNPSSTLLPNSVTAVQIKVTNNSGTTWYSDGNVPSGKHATRLATVAYVNSPYANTADPAWIGTKNQVKMVEASVPDGQTATFTFTLKAPLAQIDSYQFKMTLVEDGVKFYPYIGMLWTTSTPAPVYGYQLVGTTGLSGALPTNYTNAVTLSVKNTGNIVWYNETSTPIGAAPTRLLTTNPYYHPSVFYDSATWLANNQIKQMSSVVNPGETAIFSFNQKTPSSNGIYSDTFGMALDGLVVYPDNGQIAIKTEVADYAFSVSSLDIPTQLIAGQKYNAKVVLKNTGYATWYSDGNTPSSVHPVRLMTAGYQPSALVDQSDPNWLGTTSQIKMTTPSVAPGQTGEFNFSLIAPYNSGGQKIDLRFVLDGVTILANPVQQNVLIPPKSYSYTSVSGTINPPAILAKGQVVALKLVIKNNTNFVWYSDDVKPAQFKGGSMRLIMTAPWYRSSLLADASDPNWLGTTSQIKMTTPSVAPGQTGEFNFNWKAPQKTGNYRERFSLGLDGYVLLPDVGMEFDTNVQ